VTGGWVQLHRKLADHPVWTRERFTRGQAWVDLILLASYQDHIVVQGNRAVTVKRGQVLTSQVTLAKRWRWNRETVRAFLRLLNSLNMVAIETSKATDTGYTLVTLLNYDLYQGYSSDSKALPSAIETSIEPPSNRHRVATLNKGNKGNKGKKEKEPPVFDEGAFLGKFPPQDLEVIRQAIGAIHTTRKRGQVADSVIQAEIRWWSEQDPAQVIQGMRTYLQKGYAAQGKREAYLRGIIRNSDGRVGPPGGDPKPPVGQKPSFSPGAEAIRRAALSMTPEDCGEG